jgi:quercetin dioxygenase-like cupin family protein
MSEATQQEKSVKRTILQAIPIPALPGWEHRMVLLEYPAGVGAPVHHHPIAGPNYVVQGSILSQWQGDAEPQVFHAGNSFLDYAELSHTRAENVSQTEDLKVVACYVVKVGEPNVVMG